MDEQSKVIIFAFCLFMKDKKMDDSLKTWIDLDYKKKRCYINDAEEYFYGASPKYWPLFVKKNLGMCEQQQYDDEGNNNG